MPLLKRKRRSEPRWTIVQRKLLAVLEQQENRILGPIRVCELAGYGDWAWDRAIKDPRFVTRLNQLGVSTGKPGRGRPWKHEGHLVVSLAADPEEELAKDVWDMRKLLSDYPRHCPPASYIVDFTTLVDPDLRAQVKRYFRQSKRCFPCSRLTARMPGIAGCASCGKWWSMLQPRQPGAGRDLRMT